MHRLVCLESDERFTCNLQTWQRPTLPCLKTKYHQRWGVSRPSSEWDRVQPPRHNHQVSKVHVIFEKLVFPSCIFPISGSAFGQGPQARLRVPDFSGLLPQRRRKADQREGIKNHLGSAKMGTSNENNQVNRAISTGKLHALPHFHTRPINVVVFHGSKGNTSFKVGFPLRCLQRLSRPYIATLLCPWQDNRSTRDTSIPVLSY
jgi:hypothetical protein